MIAFMKTEGRERAEFRLAAIHPPRIARDIGRQDADEEGTFECLKALRIHYLKALNRKAKDKLDVSLTINYN